MPNLLLGVTGSVAALRTPLLYQALVEAGHQVKVVATSAALYFFEPAELPAGVLHVDADEWPGRREGRRYQREDPVLHIELRRWADALLIAPLDANTLAKIAFGLSDNCLTCVYRAWNPRRPIILAPAMNTFMWEHPLTRRHLGRLLEDHAQSPVMAAVDLEGLLAQFQSACPCLTLVSPITKRLACGDVGPGAMAETADLVEAVRRALASGNNLVDPGQPAS